jgi:hypothetical protein
LPIGALLRLKDLNFDDGVTGQSTLNPWYVKDRQTTLQEIKAAPTTVVVRGQVLAGTQAEKALDRDDARKLALDPMAKLVKHSQSDWDIAAAAVHAASSKHDTATAAQTAVAAAVVVRQSDVVSDSSAAKQKQEVKRSKEKDSSSKRKHSKDKKHKSASKKRRRDDSGSGDSDSSVHKRSKSSSSRSSKRAAAESVSIAELRQRRLDREKQARLATAHLSAQTACSSSVTPIVHEGKYVHYHEQFNPTLARQNAQLLDSRHAQAIHSVK